LPVLDELEELEGLEELEELEDWSSVTRLAPSHFGVSSFDDGGGPSSVGSLAFFFSPPHAPTTSANATTPVIQARMRRTIAPAPPNGPNRGNSLELGRATGRRSCNP
jgi:hypothetical protein